ncbi:hypothetical protein LR48_Vigan07g169600 [Vigna angularis]|uniref:Uncharacterized protein n=1 Tax=Phaseolus angularis TaxID=3914 RepID=A0A0L9UZJ2_PHAAN|nr:hypothetical protein LR48_Vigan07g169600 [Vigna angularis]
MASSSSSSRGKEKVAWIRRNASPSGWINERTLLSRFGKGFLHKPEGCKWGHSLKGQRYPGRYRVDKHYLHDGLNKEDKMIAYVLTWLLLPERLNKDRMSSEDVFLLNAIKTRIPTNWVAVLKHHMITTGDDYARKLPYGVFINKVLELQGVYVSKEERIVCKRSEEMCIPSLSSIGLKKTVNGWFFIDEQTVGSPPTLDQDHTEHSDDEDSMESS